MQEISLCPKWALNPPGLDINERDGENSTTVDSSCEENYEKRQKALSKILDKDDLSVLGDSSRKQYLSPVKGDDEETRYHPLVSMYLSKLGDLDLLTDRFNDFLEEKRTLQEQQARFLHVGLNLEPEDQQWLERAPDLAADISHQKTILESEVEMIKQECRSRGLVDVDDFQTIDVAPFSGIDVRIQNLKSIYSGLKFGCEEDEVLLTRLAPLRVSVICILWDLEESPRLQNVLHPIHGSSHMTLETFQFFRSAAQYQTSVKDVSDKSLQSRKIHAADQQ
jgi:hypothetical protein